MNDMPSYETEDASSDASESLVDALLLNRLQAIDLTLMQLQEKLRRLPALKTIQIAQAEKKRIARRILNLTGMMKDLEIEMKDLDATRAQIEKDTKRHTQQIHENASDHRALADAELALSNLAKRRDKTDYTAAQVVSQLDALKKEMGELKDKEEKCTQGLASAQTHVTQTTTEMRAEVKKLQEERERCVTELGEELYHCYTQAQNQFRGLAVEKLEGSKPSICRVELQPSALASLNEDPSAVQRCPYCRRILLVEKQR